MRDVLTRLWGRDRSRALSGTTFCDGCGQVCTPACRREALRERNQMRVRAATLYRW
jgi:MinD superfamily P-loop ATPase